MNVDTKEVETKQVEVGDVFYTSWGYDQTNVDYFQVVSVTKSGKSVYVLPIGSEYVDDKGPGGAHVVPKVGSYNPDAVPQLKKLRKSWSGVPSFYVTSYSDAYLWEGKPNYATSPGWGH